MLDTFGDDLKGFLLKPSEAFKKARSTPLSSAYQFYVVLLIIFSILLGIVVLAIGWLTFTQMVSQFETIPVFGKFIGQMLQQFSGFVVVWEIFSVYFLFIFWLISVFIGGLLIHVFVLLFAGDKDPVQTIKANMYAAAPFLILGWIPYISIIGLIWSLILLILGLSEIHEITLGKAILAVIIPIILGLILVALGGAVVASFFVALFSVFRMPF